MLKQLRLRMAALSVATTGIVFAAVMLVMAAVSEGQYLQTGQAYFLREAEQVAARLETDGWVSGSWLAQQEAQGRFVIFIESNNVPLLFHGGWTPPTTRDALQIQVRQFRERFALTAEKPEEKRTIESGIQGLHGEPYRLVWIQVPVKQDWFSVTMLEDLSGERAVLFARRWLYAGIFTAVMAALCLVSWWLSGRATRPTAESLQKQKDFIAAASHELRSPLAVIGTSVSALRVKPEKTKLLDNIEWECHQMGRLVDDMLFLANLDAKSWSMQDSEVEPDTVLIGTVDRLQQLAGEKGCTLRLELPDALLPPLRGDAERLSQLLSILINNAVEYAGGTVTVRAVAERDGLTVEVEDHGPGIPPQMRERVFDRFYRADKSRTGKQHFGLGLSIARELARLHGGTLTLRETPGGGCMFRVTLPDNRQKRGEG